jgi:hypothetical protein
MRVLPALRDATRRFRLVLQPLRTIDPGGCANHTEGSGRCGRRGCNAQSSAGPGRSSACAWHSFGGLQRVAPHIVRLACSLRSGNDADVDSYLAAQYWPVSVHAVRAGNIRVFGDCFADNRNSGHLRGRGASAARSLRPHDRNCGRVFRVDQLSCWNSDGNLYLGRIIAAGRQRYLRPLVSSLDLSFPWPSGDSRRRRLGSGDVRFLAHAFHVHVQKLQRKRPGQCRRYRIVACSRVAEKPVISV